MREQTREGRQSRETSGRLLDIQAGANEGVKEAGKWASEECSDSGSVSPEARDFLRPWVWVMS